MGLLSRLHTFVGGTKALASQVNAEVNQILAGHNDHDTRIAAIETTQVSGYYTKSEVDNIIVQAEFGTPPSGGVSLTHMTKGVKAGIVAAKAYAHQNMGGF